MRTWLRRAVAGLALLSVWAAPMGLASAASLDFAADRVVGQPNMATGGDNQGGLSGSSMSGPTGAAVDPRTGRLYVTDNGNNRVLSWPNATAFNNGQAADMIIGQTSPTYPGASPVSINQPFAVALESRGDLYVSDNGYTRVTEYDAPLSSHQAAHLIFGQPDAFSIDPNNGGITRFGLQGPNGLAVDGAGNLFAVDGGNRRVLEYDLPLGERLYLPLTRR